MDGNTVTKRRDILVRCVADGFCGHGNGGPRGAEDLLALLLAERVVDHLEKLGFIVLRRGQR